MLINSLLSLAAILALFALNRWLGRSGRMAREPGPAAARIELDLIDFAASEGEPANGGRAWVAVGRMPADLAVAVALGDGWVTRRFGPGTLRRVDRDGARLMLHARDFTFPSVALEFADPQRAACWERRFAGLAGTAQDSPPTPADGVQPAAHATAPSGAVEHSS
jgi:hypothetical protein